MKGVIYSHNNHIVTRKHIQQKAEGVEYYHTSSGGRDSDHQWRDHKSENDFGARSKPRPQLVGKDGGDIGMKSLRQIVHSYSLTASFRVWWELPAVIHVLNRNIVPYFLDLWISILKEDQCPSSSLPQPFLWEPRRTPEAKQKLPQVKIRPGEQSG